jgi:DNA polymerase-1
MRSARQGFEKLYPTQGTLLLELGTEETEQKPKAARIAGRDEAEVFADKLRKASVPAFCGVYEGKVPHLKLRALGLSTGDENAVVESGSEAWDILYPLLEDASLRWVTIDLKSFYHVGGSMEAHVEDVQLAAYLADPSIGTADVEKLRSIWLPSAPAISADEDETEKAAEGAGIVSKLWPVIFEKLKGYDMEKLYNDMEKPLVAVLAEMEENGIYVNRDRLSAQAEAVGKKLLDLEQEIYALAKHPFNINSPKQLGEVLFDELGLPAQKKTKTGYSTNAEVLNSLRYVHPIVEKILEYRL